MPEAEIIAEIMKKNGKKHAIIPIFIPHLGCPYDCVFCNQREITARTAAPDTRQVDATIKQWLTTLQDAEVEIAFYGGSFTGIPMDMQSAYLDVAKKYKDRGIVKKLHLSTRPDFIDEEILENLRAHGVDVIELGAQSFDDRVLALSNRGHTADDTRRASRLIRSYGFELGIQLMIGLPGDSRESCVMSAREAVKLEPELARLYPTIVLDDTRLYQMYREGLYTPLTREEAVATTADMYRILDDAGIRIMRVGLKSTDIIGDGGAINGGTYHPAFRQLVEGRIAREKIEPLLEKASSQAEAQAADAGDGSAGEERGANIWRDRTLKVDVFSSPAWFSNMIGNSGENRKRFAEEFLRLNIRYRSDPDIRDGGFRVVVKEDPAEDPA